MFVFWVQRSLIIISVHLGCWLQTSFMSPAPRKTDVSAHETVAWWGVVPSVTLHLLAFVKISVSAFLSVYGLAVFNTAA